MLRGTWNPKGSYFGLGKDPLWGCYLLLAGFFFIHLCFEGLFATIAEPGPERRERLLLALGNAIPVLWLVLVGLWYGWMMERVERRLPLARERGLPVLAAFEERQVVLAGQRRNLRLVLGGALVLAVVWLMVGDGVMQGLARLIP